MFSCDKCRAVFARKMEMDLHQVFKHGVTPGKPCGMCGEYISEKNLRRHELSCGKLYKCSKCGGKFKNEHTGRRHEDVCGAVPEKRVNIEPTKVQLLSSIPDNEDMFEYESAYENRLKSYFVRSEEGADMVTFLFNCKKRLVSTITKQLKTHCGIKINLLVECLFVNTVGDLTDRAFKTSNVTILRGTNIEDILFKKFKTLTNEMEESSLKKSGWSLHVIDGLRLRINKYNPLRGSTYIPLSESIEKKKACINVQNYDEKCFMYSILAKFVNIHPERVNNYENLKHGYDFSCVTFPTALEEIRKFEKINLISINVFGVEKKGYIYPLKIADEELPDHRDLLLIEEGEKKHYVYIKNFKRLVGSQVNKREHNLEICKRCLAHFDDRYGEKAVQKLEYHKRLCSQQAIARVEMPTNNPILKFKNFERTIKLPFVIYADFESILLPHSTCQPDPKLSYTMPYQTHLPMSYSIYVKSTIEVKSLPKKPIIYRGVDAGEKFMNQLVDLAKRIENIYARNKPMKKLSEHQLTEHSMAEKCYLCRMKFTVEDCKVFDHCHITGEYRGAAHNSCNLKCRTPNYIPVFIHNLSGYDAHYIVKQLGCDSERVEVIANSEENYISFSKYVGKVKLRFIDTFRFMPYSLEKLVKTLPGFPETSKYFGPEKVKLVSRKGVFPYDYLDSWEKLEDKKLPRKEHFYSILNACDINDEDYEHAQNVWNHFGIKNLGEYSDLYLITDVLLLADVFEAFRESTIRTHFVDAAHYFTSPGLTWDSMLKYTGVELELLQDYEQLLMVEAGIRGGICQVSHRFAEANNKYIPGFDEKKPSQFITYEDANNQYGWAMSHSLPYGGFEWVSAESIDLASMKEDDPIGHLLEVDLNYPESLHRLHSDFPFLAESINPPESSFKKLIPHLGNRKHYVVHYMSLKQALDHGLELVKIHRVLKFNQSAWLKGYVEYNNDLRKQAKNDFEKDLFKLFNNAMFGKTMESVRKRIDIRLVTNAKQLENLIAKPTFIDRTIYGDNLVSVHLAKRKIIFDKPIYIGMCVLDISKTLMYQYHYDVLLPFYGAERLKLMYTDTDSFIHLVQTEDIYQDKLKFINFLDTSDYPSDHLCYSNQNRKVLGKFKDEAQGKPIMAFAGLRAKMYALKISEQDIIKKAKGVKRSSLKKYIEFEDYVKCIFSGKHITTPMNIIMSKKHNISTYQINKLSLSPFDDKRLILEDGISTRAIGFVDGEP